MRILILGGGYAGVACATRLAYRARKTGKAVEVTLLNESDLFVERIRLHQAASGQRLPHRSLERLLSRAGVGLVVGRADGIDLEQRAVHMGEARIAWDRLVLALGSRAASFDVPGAQLHAHSLNPGSVANLAGELGRLPHGATVAVVGGGLTGIEAATEIGESHPWLQVELYSRSLVAGGWSRKARAHVLSVFDRLGIACHEGLAIREVRPGELRLSNAARPFDLCIWTAGFGVPALACSSGLAVNAAGQVLVDARLRSISHPQVYAAGDIADPALVSGQALPMGCKTALPTGAHAGENLARELTGEAPLAFDWRLPFFCVSLGRRDGLIQKADAEGRPLGSVLTGRLAALFKETVCRYTWRSLALESLGWPNVSWQRAGRRLQTLEQRTGMQTS